MSGIKCLLDTNVVIGLLKQHTAAVALIETHQLDLNQVAISQITRMELLGYPGLPKEEERQIQGFLQNSAVLLIDAAVEQRAIQLRRSGNCKLPDAIIAATAQIHHLTLLTLDERLSAFVTQNALS
ncbi:MAG: type II toxin-antitoxin system VapC family toxin [Gallionella sp.]